MKTARDLILELYKEDHITRGETHLLLDAINKTVGTTFIPTPYYPDWTYRPYVQPSWTISSIYFDDKNTGTIFRVNNDGLHELSSYGTSEFFNNNTDTNNTNVE